jgi:hypothetical protein
MTLRPDATVVLQVRRHDATTTTVIASVRTISRRHQTGVVDMVHIDEE